MTTSPAENKRSEERYLSEETILIEIITSGSQSAGKVIMSNTLDISNHGLLALVDEDISPGSIMRLCVDPKDEEPIFLIAEVKWHRPDRESGGYRMGFKLYESDDTDIARWHEHVRAKRAS